MFRCKHCPYGTPYLHNLKRHSDKIHQANYQVPHIQHYANTIPQYQPNEVKQQGCGLNQAINHEGGAPTSTVVPNTQHHANIIKNSHSSASPHIQYNKVKQQELEAPTSKQYSMSKNVETRDETDDEMDTDYESDHDTDNESEIDKLDIYEILSDISLSFDRLKELKEQYLKALPQLKDLEGDEINNFSCKYAELKVDVIDENDGLENASIQFGKGVDVESEDDESEDGEEFAEEDDEVGEEDDSEGDTDEEAVDEDIEEDDDTNEEVVDEENEVEKVKKTAECKGCRKEGFFDFVFDAEKFMDSDFK